MRKTLNNIFKKLSSFFSVPANLAIWAVVALIVPNLVLDITETTAPIWKAANILLPAGVYILIISSWRKIGVTTLLTLPFMILGAFQLVLSYLYGESIIAVDMFLNVVTTNFDEATELLENLLVAILSVVVLYLPPLIWAIVFAVRGVTSSAGFRKKGVRMGLALTIAGAVLSIAGTIMPHCGVFNRDIFPVNVINNLIEAVNRTRETSHYSETSKDFTYNARSVRPADEREIYLFVIGETSRAINWEMEGYERETNPRLKKEANVMFCPRAMSESNTTHKSVPMLMSFATSENFDSIHYCKSIITAMKEAGFYTRFFSNQAPNRSYTQYFGDEADDVRYCDFSRSPHPYDTDLLPWIDEAMNDSIHTKQFIVLHTYGSHFLYRDRYPREYAEFLPDDAIDANVTHRSDLINAYDNTVRFTDAFLAEAIGCLKSTHCRSALFYSADHGEDIFDDDRERFLHASPHPTYYQLHVAMLVWLSEEVAESEPSYMDALAENSKKPVSPQKSMFNTAMEVAGVVSPRVNTRFSLVNEDYSPVENAVYLTDLNQAVLLEESGMTAEDIDKSHKVLSYTK